MGSVLDMGKTLSAAARTVPGQEGCLTASLAGPRKGPARAAATEDSNAHDVEAAKLIYEAVGVFGAESWGAELSSMTKGEVDSGLVAKMRSGKKSTPLRALLPLLRDEQAAMVLITAMCRIAGLAPPRPIQKVTRRQVESVMARKVRECVVLWQALSRQVADECGTTTDDVDAAMTETA
jgi:hypothetical protein